MPANLVTGFKFDGFHVSPEDIKWGEADSVEIDVLVGKTLVKTKLRRFSLSITIRGVEVSKARTYIDLADGAGASAASGSIQTRSISVGPRTLQNAFLSDADFTPPVEVVGTDMIEELSLSYESTVYT